MQALPFVFSLLVAAWLTPLVVNRLAEAGSTRENYRGRRLPIPLGIVIVPAALVALAWANSPWPRSYEAFWTTELALSLNDHVLSTETCVGL